MKLLITQPQRGVALITVLLVLALATVTVVSMSSERQLDIRRTENQQRGDQAWTYAQSLESWAMLRLQDKDEAWQKSIRVTENGQVELRATIDDLQGKINLNNLMVDGEVSDEDLKRMKRLLKQLELRPELMDAILDWIDADGDIRYPYGAEDEVYSRKRPPRRVSNRLFADVSELLLVQGMTQEIYDKLRPFVFAAPNYSPININTAPPQILRCLADKISADAAESMFRASGKPFSKLADFLIDEAVVGSGIRQYGLTVESKLFLLAGSVDMGRARLRFESHLQKDGKGKTAVIRRARSGWSHG